MSTRAAVFFFEKSKFFVWHRDNRLKKGDKFDIIYVRRKRKYYEIGF